MVSSRGAARAVAQQVGADQEEEPQPEVTPKRASKRRMQRGSAAIEGDQLTKAMLERTVKTDDQGNNFVDRASFGEGQLQWYGIGVSV